MELRLKWIHVKLRAPHVKRDAKAGKTSLMRDYEVIEACNEANVTMVLTGQRAFKH